MKLPIGTSPVNFVRIMEHNLGREINYNDERKFMSFIEEHYKDFVMTMNEGKDEGAFSFNYYPTELEKVYSAMIALSHSRAYNRPVTTSISTRDLADVLKLNPFMVEVDLKKLEEYGFIKAMPLDKWILSEN